VLDRIKFGFKGTKDWIRTYSLFVLLSRHCCGWPAVVAVPFNSVSSNRSKGPKFCNRFSFQIPRRLDQIVGPMTALLQHADTGSNRCRSAHWFTAKEPLLQWMGSWDPSKDTRARIPGTNDTKWSPTLDAFKLFFFKLKLQLVLLKTSHWLTWFTPLC